MALDAARQEALLGRALSDLGAVTSAALIVIGDRLGLYKAMRDGQPMTPGELAARTDTDPRYVREWLCNQAAGGYLDYHAETGRFCMSEEQASVLADDTSPTFLPGGFQVCLAATRAMDKLCDGFRTGEGIGWHEHDADLFVGTERFFRPGYAAHLISEWLPALNEDVTRRLQDGALVADVGCGHGASTLLMARAFPKSTFFGFDYHGPSIESARARAHEAGVGDNVCFDVARAQDYPGAGYDLVTVFDCLHDMGDPVGASRHVRGTLRPGASWMVVEPYASDRIEENLNPIGRCFYGASTLICTPASRAQEVGLCLGAQAGESRLREVVLAGGFTSFERVAATPFNLVFEART